MHVNEVACAILGFERDGVSARASMTSGPRHPHYLRLRAAVASLLAHPERERERVELTLFLRGRDHYYVLRPTPFRAARRARAPASSSCFRTSPTCATRRPQREQLSPRCRMSCARRSPRCTWRSSSLAPRAARRSTASTRELVDAAQEDVVRLEDVAQRLLDLRALARHGIALERTHVDLGEIVAALRRASSRCRRARRVSRSSSRDHGDGASSGDQTKLTWALSNLIANALRYTPRGRRVTLDVEGRDGPVRDRRARHRAGHSRPSSGNASSSASRRGGRRRDRRRRARPRDRPRHRPGARRTHPPRERGRPRQPLHDRAAADG